MDLLITTHAAATWAMLGIIWTVQLVVYPAMRDVPLDAFTRYEVGHQRRMSRILGLVAPVEAVTALALVFRPGALPWSLTVAGALVLAGLWTLTGLVYAPAHGTLASDPRPSRIERLIRTNWVRTLGWSVRAVLAGAMLLWI